MKELLDFSGEYFSIKVIGLGEIGKKVIADLFEKCKQEFVEILKLCKLDNGTDFNKMISNTDMLFIVWNMEDVADYENAIMIAKEAHQQDCLTIGISTDNDNSSIPSKMLYRYMDTWITIPEKRISQIVASNCDILLAFNQIQSLISVIIQRIIKVIIVPGMIGIDLYDVKCALCSNGAAVVRIGVAGEGNRGKEAARLATQLLPIESKQPVFAIFTLPLSFRVKEIEDARDEICKNMPESTILVYGTTDTNNNSLEAMIIASNRKTISHCSLFYCRRMDLVNK